MHERLLCRLLTSGTTSCLFLSTMETSQLVLKSTVLGREKFFPSRLKEWSHILNIRVKMKERVQSAIKRSINFTRWSVK
ncbi:unnamed protein product [Hymenolepis diminuta]|uniref:Uncharacterized protein n=1 Tax=Hymenolepis diminuta TaxID=6216 RepID=A0A564Z344_HYMDI|nr:unnamed protein product [Hymenolepis diminuta]